MSDWLKSSAIQALFIRKTNNWGFGVSADQHLKEARSIGERIRDARKAAGLSQADLARLIGVSQPAIATWESGVHDPRRVVLAKLADALSTSLEWLAAGTRSMQESDRQAAAAYLRRPLRHVPVISFASAEIFANNPDADPHSMAEDYIPITASVSQLFALFVDDPAIDRAFPAGSLVIIDYSDQSPGEGNFCLAIVDNKPLIRRLHREEGILAPFSLQKGYEAYPLSDTINIIGSVRLSIRFH